MFQTKRSIKFTDLIALNFDKRKFGCPKSSSTNISSSLCQEQSWMYLLETHVCALSHVGLFATLWTVAHQAPLSMGFSKQEHWSGLPFPSPGDLPDTAIKALSPVSPALQVDSLPLEPSGKTLIRLHNFQIPFFITKCPKPSSLKFKDLEL